MTFNKKVFWRVMLAFLVMDLCLLMCACGDWESQAVTIIGLIGPALQSIIAILAALGAKVPAQVMATFSNWAQQTQTALVTLKGLVQSVKTSVAAAQPGIVNAIGAALSAIAAQLQAILPELHIDDPNSQAKVEEAFAAIIGFLGELAALLPAIAPSMTLAQAGALHDKAKYSARKFKSNFNAAVSYFGSQYEI